MQAIEDEQQGNEKQAQDLQAQMQIAQEQIHQFMSLLPQSLLNVVKLSLATDASKQ